MGATTHRRACQRGMGAAIGTGDKKSFDVVLNLVPFIDLMSCMVAFLLVTALWIDGARIEIQPAGRANGECIGSECDDPRLSLLITPDEIWLGSQRSDLEKIARTESEHDWAGLARSLARFRSAPRFDHARIEIAADSSRAHPIAY